MNILTEKVVVLKRAVAVISQPALTDQREGYCLTRRWHRWIQESQWILHVTCPIGHVRVNLCAVFGGCLHPGG